MPCILTGIHIHDRTMFVYRVHMNVLTYEAPKSLHPVIATHMPTHPHTHARIAHIHLYRLIPYGHILCINSGSQRLTYLVHTCLHAYTQNTYANMCSHIYSVPTQIHVYILHTHPPITHIHVWQSDLSGSLAFAILQAIPILWFCKMLPLEGTGRPSTGPGFYN